MSRQRLAELEHRKVGVLEDLQAIRRLHWAYGYYIDFNRPDEVADLFAEDGSVVFLSGEYVGQAGVERLYGDWIAAAVSPAASRARSTALLLDHFQMQDIITVAPDRQTAKGRFHGILLGGWHDDFQDTREEMMPQQFMEAGIYENDYVRERRRVEDQAAQLHDAVAGQLRGRLGAYHRAPPAGREALSRKIRSAPTSCCRAERHRQTWPYRQDVPMHFAHPKFGAAARRAGKK